MCPKSALQCQLTCLYVLYTVDPSPLLPRSNTNCHESSENFLSKKKQVLGKLLILINYCTLLQKRHSGAVDQSRDCMGEVMSSILLLVGFFLLIQFFQKDAS
jgi:hypothetical protein